MKTLNELRDIVSRIAFPGHRVVVELGPIPQVYLRVVCDEGLCNVTGQPMGWKGRKFLLSAHMTDGEVVQTAFMAVMAANEHETREKFTYRGVSVFDPHYDIEKLVELRRQPDALKERDAA